MDVPTHKIVGIAALASSVALGIGAFVMSRMALRAVEEQEQRHNVSYFLDQNRVKAGSSGDIANNAPGETSDLPAA